MREGVTPRKRHRTAYMRGYRARQAVERDGAGLLPFQAAFVAAVCRQERPPDIAALSVPRGNGKSWLCGKIVSRSLTPGDQLFDAGVENVLVSASRPQAGIVLEFARQALGDADGYRWRKDGVEHWHLWINLAVVGDQDTVGSPRNDFQRCGDLRGRPRLAGPSGAIL